MKVRMLIGANAYACIRENGVQHDILLSPGKSAIASLREYAAENRKQAAAQIERAERAERAALHLESSK